MKEFIFNKKDYSTYEDFYKDIAIKMDAIKIDDYYDSSTFEYNANICVTDSVDENDNYTHSVFVSRFIFDIILKSVKEKGFMEMKESN